MAMGEDTWFNRDRTLIGQKSFVRQRAISCGLCSMVRKQSGGKELLGSSGAQGNDDGFTRTGSFVVNGSVRHLLVLAR